MSKALLIFAGVVILFLVVATRGANPSLSCQNYLETARRAAYESDGSLSMPAKQAWALESIAWSLVYQSCKTR